MKGNHMSNNRISQLSARLQTLSTESEIMRRGRKEEASKAIVVLRRISEADVEMLSAIAPKLKVIVHYTEEDLIANKNDEVITIKEVLSQLDTYLEERLRYYEEQL